MMKKVCPRDVEDLSVLTLTQKASAHPFIRVRLSPRHTWTSSTLLENRIVAAVGVTIERVSSQ